MSKQSRKYNLTDIMREACIVQGHFIGDIDSSDNEEMMRIIIMMMMRND